MYIEKIFKALAILGSILLVTLLMILLFIKQGVSKYRIIFEPGRIWSVPRADSRRKGSQERDEEKYIEYMSKANILSESVITQKSTVFIEKKNRKSLDYVHKLRIKVLVDYIKHIEWDKVPIKGFRMYGRQIIFLSPDRTYQDILRDLEPNQILAEVGDLKAIEAIDYIMPTIGRFIPPEPVSFYSFGESITPWDILPECPVYLAFKGMAERDKKFVVDKIVKYISSEAFSRNKDADLSIALERLSKIITDGGDKRDCRDNICMLLKEAAKRKKEEIRWAHLERVIKEHFKVR